MATKRKTAASAPPAQVSQATPASELPSAATDSGAEVILRTNFAVAEQDSVALLHAASLLLDADTPEKVNVALDHNLKLWIAIKAVLLNGDSPIEPEVKANLRNLAQYVVGTTMEATGGSIEERRLVSLARLNMGIAEGLLGGQQSKLIQDRAYQIWEEEGRPHGREQDHWLRAEAEVTGQLKA
ncbi:DUF2934 domain-containing protein [Azospirillum agricola]|uniref:DUF2934 domain-containing protein n=1 Tax=Azospirillum agricola TaxID=1720247 RepID=UPI000A0F2B36|nr:DUF2934 domain-containing protein [Azospirillum agricola]SMH35680.1 protein FlaF [Azospirillum lipoferum]